MGTGSLPRAKWIGVNSTRTVKGVEIFVGAMRYLLAGKTVTASSEAFVLDGLTLKVEPVPPIPVDVMAIRPRMFDLSAKVGDGVSLSAGASREYLRVSIASLEESLAKYGRDRADFRISAVVATVVSDDIAAARRDLVTSGPLRFRDAELQIGVDLPDYEQVSAVLANGGPDAAAEALQR